MLQNSSSKKSSSVASAVPNQPSLPFMDNKKTSNKEEDPTQVGKIVSIPIEFLNPAAFNPPGRTTPEAIEVLKHEIQTCGIKSPIAVLHRPPEFVNVIVDGHRRVACGKALKFKTVPCIIHTTGKPHELWATLNKGSRKTTAYEWLQVFVKSNFKIKAPKSVNNLIAEAEQIFGGKNGLQFLIDNSISPKIVTNINIVHKVIRSYPSLKCPTKDQIGKWMIQHHMQNPAYEAIRACERQGTKRSEYVAAKRIVKAILLNQPLSQS